jgi:outer membrane protein assembly factor BamB
LFKAIQALISNINLKEVKKMKKSKITALIVMLTFATTLVTFPIVSAHDPPWSLPTYAYISVTPDLVGVNQQVLIYMWLDTIPPTAIGAYGDRWEGYKVEVTKPDGSTVTLGPITSNPVGTAHTPYMPDQIGTYTFQMSFPGQTLAGDNPHPIIPMGIGFVGDYYEPSTSAKVSLTVQQDPIEGYPSTPLPEGYWERPISKELRDWWQISGNWLGAGHPTDRFNRYSKGPESAHIVWTRPIWSGGLVGGEYGMQTYYDGIAYERLWEGEGPVTHIGETPIIIDGRLYYNVRAPPRYGWYCIDLRTGEEIWFHNSTGPTQIEYTVFTENYPQLSFGQVYYYESPNQQGALPYLWVTYGGNPMVMGQIGPNWQMYDAFSGNWICNIENVPDGKLARSPDGSVLVYKLDTMNGWLALWNSSRAIWYKPMYISNEAWMWRPPLGGTVDGRNGYSWNVTIPAGLRGGIDLILEDRIIGSSGLELTQYTSDPWSVWALSLEPGNEGELLWRKDYPAPAGNLTLNMGSVSLEDGVFTIQSKETMQWWGYDLNTGNLIWGPTESQTAWDMYSFRGGTTYGKPIAYGKLLSHGQGGILYAYNVKTGELLWTFEAKSIGFESPTPNFQTALSAIADGKIYLTSRWTHLGDPVVRGAQLYCINIENGEELWSITHWGNGPAIADGYLVDLDSYDNRIYCFGKGQTETTVMGPEDVQPLGSKVLIKGTVMDQSPGAKGTPAIADEYMSEWMEYLYMQKSCPEYAEGVEVVITTFDPNGNTYELGRTTTDMAGTFGIEVEPPVPGLYKIIATFEGSESYYSSYAQTYISVDEAPSTAQAMEPELTSPTPELAQPAASELTEITSTEQIVTTETPLITTETVIFIAIAIACINSIITFWVLRKRK